tara:strand:+ start:178 stop:1992 length:1815 start_codon:yes stop_codon:yes gene_type:complete
MNISLCTTPIRPTPTTFPPLGSMAIIQSLRKDKIDVSFFHIDYFRYTHQEIVDYYRKNNFDVVLISAVVSTAYAYTKYLCKIIKEINNKTLIIVGGNLAASAEILHRKCDVDFCVIGDGELIIRKIIKNIKLNKINIEDLKSIKGITFLYNQEFFFTGYEHALPADELERPDWSILEKINCLDYYMPKGGGSIKGFNPNFETEGRTATIITAKGCVAKCTFCHRFEKGYRVSPNESLVQHAKMLKEKYGVTILDIGDENFGSYKETAKELVVEFNKLGLKWKAAGVRAHTVSPEILKHYKNNGCEVIIYGIESGSRKMLEVMEKKVKYEQNVNALKWTYEAGLSTIVQLIIGMPGETDETINETIEFLNEVSDYYPDNLRKDLNVKISINYAQALPGTPLYEYARETGYIPNSVDGEEKYLIDISDKDAYDNDHFINYTQQPLLKVLSWRYKIGWMMWRDHAQKHLKLELNKYRAFEALFVIFLNKIFKKQFSSSFLTRLSQISLDKKVNFNSQTSDHYNTNTFKLKYFCLMAMLPWNKFTYPLIAVLLAWKEKKNLKWFFKLVFEHLLWSLNFFKKLNLPNITLRKVVKIPKNDPAFELRKGR